jgi:glycogen(starch) synthase
VTVIPNGIDPSQWRVPAARRARLRRELGTPLVVYAGRLEAEKGVQTLIDAVPRLRRRIPGVRVVVIGQGTIADELRQRARTRRAGGAVTFAGWVPEDQLRAIVSAADVAVVPSLYEPFGFVALEAIALGAPLAVARTGGLADIVDDGRTGRSFTPGDPARLADVLAEVLSHPRASRRLAEAARAGLEERFGWPDIAARTADVYAAAVVDPAAGLGRHPGHLPPRVGNLLAAASG